MIYRGTTPLDGPKELPDYGGESRFTSYNNIDPRKRELTLHQCFLLPPEVSGFELKRKAWCKFTSSLVSSEEGCSANTVPSTLPYLTTNLAIFEVDHIKPRNEKEEKNATGNLIIERNDLDILNTIPDRKAKFKTTAADFVAGKGEGRVFLFYGTSKIKYVSSVAVSNGLNRSSRHWKDRDCRYVLMNPIVKLLVCKLTALECIAKAKHRPLLKITNSDLGEIAMVEKNLQKWFTLAERWGAIMLIDEADNFLQKRADGAVKLNNLITGRKILGTRKTRLIDLQSFFEVWSTSLVLSFW